MMARLLSLDLATRTGWAFGATEAGDPVSGVLQLPKSGVELGPFLHSYGHWLRATVVEYEVEVIVFEEPIMPNGFTQLATLLKLYGLIGMTETVAFTMKVPCRQVAAGTWKKGFCGKAGFGKSAKPYPPIIKCHELGWRHIKDDNEADAVGLHVYSCRMFSPKEVARFDPLFREQHLKQAA
jgi:hypothetical protein